MDFGLSSGEILFLPVMLIILILISISIILIHKERLSEVDTAAGRNWKPDHGVAVNIKDPLAADKFANILRHLLQQNCNPGRPLIILCIGSDRCTGDCLGPLVGSFLEETISEHYEIYGTLKKPVHALNLENCLQEIRFKHHHPFIIAIDASLGYSQKDVGTVIINKGKLNPGNAVNKSLPPVGDLSIAAVVNDFYNLYSTRLYSVTDIASFIAKGLQYVLNNMEQKSPENIPKIS